MWFHGKWWGASRKTCLCETSKDCNFWMWRVWEELESLQETCESIPWYILLPTNTPSLYSSLKSKYSLISDTSAAPGKWSKWLIWIDRTGQDRTSRNWWTKSEKTNFQHKNDNFSPFLFWLYSYKTMNKALEGKHVQNVLIGSPGYWTTRVGLHLKPRKLFFSSTIREGDP